MKTMLELIADWGWLLALLANGAIGWVAWSAKTYFASKASLEDLTDHISDQRQQAEQRMTRMERRLDGVPSHADLSRIHQRLDEITASNARQEGALPSMQNTLDIIVRALVKDRD